MCMRKFAFTLAAIVVLSKVVMSQPWDRQMQVGKMDIRIQADAFAASTFIEMEFYNSTHTEMEGLYNFELNPGQAITAFQLELNGKFRNGSIEEKWKARNAYNTIVGKRVDPALLQMDYYNHYSLRIYPVPAMGSRRITMTIQQLLPLDNGAAIFKLPLMITDLIEQINVNIGIKTNTGPPTVNQGLLTNQQFANVKNCYYELQWKAAGVKADKPLSFSIPVQIDKPMLGIKNEAGKTFFALRIKPSDLRSYTIYPKKITVFWDISATGSSRDISKEISFLKHYLFSNHISKLQVITFNQRVKDTANFTTENIPDNSWETYLRSLLYEGATRLDILDFSGIHADAILLFSDGRSSVGSKLPVPGSIHVYCISTGANSDSLQLERVVGKTGGKYINLNFLSSSRAVDLAGKAENILIDLLVSGQRLSINQRLSDLQEDTLLLTGVMPSTEKNTMVLSYGNNGNIHGEEKIEISYDNICQESLIDRIDMLSVFDSYAKNNSDWLNVLDFGKQENVVTQSTSYIVLEKIEDYIRYNILPPKELESQCDMNIFVKANKDRRDQYKKINEFERLSEVATAYNERISWWDKKEPIISLKEKNPEPAITVTKKETQPVQTRETVSKANVEVPDMIGDRKVYAMSEVVVTAMGQTRQPKELGYAVSRIRSAELTQAKVVNVQNALTGKVSGLHVQTVNNGVFADTRITLRGIRSLTGNNQPMVILDGMHIDIRFLSLMNPNDIRDVTILKSGAATAIYGPDGVNGALLITTKTGSRFSTYYQSRERYRLKDQEDMDYSVEFRSVPDKDKIEKYHEMKNNYRDNAGFYFDMAQDLFESGYRKEALDILYTAADITNGDWQVLKAIGYTLESWKEFDEAISLYNLMLSENEIDLQTCRDLALTCYQKGYYQQAVDIFYKGILNDTPNKELKAMMLQEMNAIIAVHKEKIDISKINQELIRPLSVDLRITFECNTRNLSNNISIAEPGGNSCSAKKPMTLFGGRLSPKDAGNTGNNVYTVSPKEYQIKNAVDGKYKLRINYTGFNGYYYNARIPTMIKMTTFKNFGKPDQSIKVENVIMDYQYGNVEIGTVKW